MNPIKFEGSNVTFAENQPEYNPLPAHYDHKSKDGEVTTIWEFTDEEREMISKGQNLLVSSLTFHRPLQPMNFSLVPSNYQHKTE